MRRWRLLLGFAPVLLPSFATLSCATVPGGVRCAESGREAGQCDEALSECEGGDEDACALIVSNPKVQEGEAWAPVEARAAIAGCKTSSAICGALAFMFLSSESVRDRPEAWSRLSEACLGEFGNTSACAAVARGHLGTVAPGVLENEYEPNLRRALSAAGWIDLDAQQAASYTGHLMKPPAPLAPAATQSLATAQKLLDRGCSLPVKEVRYGSFKTSRYSGSDVSNATSKLDEVLFPQDSCQLLSGMYWYSLVPRPSPGVLRELSARIKVLENAADKALEGQEQRNAEESAARIAQINADLDRSQAEARAMAQATSAVVQQSAQASRASMAAAQQTASDSRAFRRGGPAPTNSTVASATGPSTAPPQQPPEQGAAASAADAEKRRREQQRQSELADCLAQPVTPARVERANPFGAERQDFEGLLRYAQVSCAPPKDWKSCMGDDAMQALWSAKDRTKTDADNLGQMYSEAGAAPGAPACQGLIGIEDSETYCLTMSRQNCIDSLRRIIGNLQCAEGQLPYVWQAQNAHRDELARQRRDRDCHQRFGN